MQASKGMKQPTVLPSHNTSEPHQQPRQHDNPKGAVVALIPWQQTKLSNWFKTCSTRGKAWLVLET